MIDIEQIASFYPKPLQPYKKNLLREYLLSVPKKN